MSEETAGLVGAAATALPAIKAGIDVFRNAIGLAKEAKELLPDGAKKDAIERSLAAAEQESKIGQAQIAQALGFTLCKCAFPPPIMLSKGYHPRHGEELFECPSCKKQHPSQHHFDELDRLEARMNPRRQVVMKNDWMA
jgi:hypothetical protein